MFSKRIPDSNSQFPRLQVPRIKSGKDGFGAMERCKAGDKLKFCLLSELPRGSWLFEHTFADLLILHLRFIHTVVAEEITLRRRSRQENIELKTPYEMAKKLDIQDGGAPPYNADAYEDVWGDTEYDIRDMRRLGKMQEFKVIANVAESSRNVLKCM